MRIASIVVALALISGTAGGSEAFVEAVSPPVVARGKTTRVVLSGTNLGRATGLWTSLPATQVRADPVGPGDDRHAAFEIEVASDAPLGLYGLRLTTGDGLSNAHLFLIDDVPIRAAETLRTPAPVALPVAIAGAFREAVVDRFTVEVQAGERLSFEAVANRLGKDADPLVTIRDPRGRTVAERDNDGGLWFDCRFEHAFAESGPHAVEIRDARFEGVEGRTYVLRIGHFPAARSALPFAFRPGRKVSLQLPGSGDAVLEFEPGVTPGGYFGGLRRPGDDAPSWFHMRTTDLTPVLEGESGNTPARATRVEVPAYLQGHLARPGESDWFAMDLAKGQAIDVRAEGRGIGSPVDVELTLLDPSGREAQRIDDVGLDDASFRFTASAEGIHRLRVRDVTGGGGPDHVYGVEVRRDAPRFQVASEVASLTIPRGQRQPIPLAVTRTNYDGPIFLAIAGRPPGLMLEPDMIPPGASQLVCSLVADESRTEGLATVRIEASAGRGVLASFAKTQPLVDRQAVNVDLIKTALREDQRCLPPTLTDRIALLVTPPAPFTFELPESTVDLPRFLHAGFPIVVGRSPGFRAPIAFAARGGPIGDKAELRVQVYAEIPESLPDGGPIEGVVRSRNLANTAKTLASIDATALHDGRSITLTRTFLLDLKPAFEVAPEPAKLAIKPGDSAKFKLLTPRIGPFDGAVTVTPAKVPGVVLPESIAVPAGDASVEVDLKIEADAAPGPRRVGFPAVARVGEFEEEVRGTELSIEVQKP